MLEKFNTEVFGYINRFAGVNVILDRAAIITAQYLPFIFILFLVYLWLANKTEYRNIALYSTYCAIIGVCLNLVITLFYYHPRPYMLSMGTVLIHHVPETSFPSDHTTFMLSIAFMLIFFKESRIAGIGLLILGLAGGTARVFCGIHFPVDILGSLGVAALSSLIVYLLKNRLIVLNKIIKGMADRISPKRLTN